MEVPFGGLNDVPLNFGSKISPKTEILGAWIVFLSLNEKKIQILITWTLPSRSWQNFYRRYAPRMRLRGWSHGPVDCKVLAVFPNLGSAIDSRDRRLRLTGDLAKRRCNNNRSSPQMWPLITLVGQQRDRQCRRARLTDNDGVCQRRRTTLTNNDDDNPNR